MTIKNCKYIIIKYEYWNIEYIYKRAIKVLDALKDFLIWFFSDAKRVITIVIIIILGLVVNSKLNSMASEYFSQIESVQGVERVNKGLFSNSNNAFSGLLDGALGAEKQEIYEDVKSNDSIEGDIESIPYKGTFNYAVTWGNSIFSTNNGDVVVVTISKYTKKRTYKIPVGIININLKQ